MLEQIINSGVCPHSVAGWLWYCDQHDTHGQADEEAEAHALSDAHLFFKLDLEPFGTQPEDVCDLYLIDVANKITYRLGDD